ncbi:MAG: LCP family protein [Syntrophomonadaceae bacterium]|nr:LCP family protein [Syntrophomonadaceae bacterium]
MGRLNNKKGIAVVILIFIATFLIGRFMGDKLGSIFNPSVEGRLTRGKPVNVLVMGVDARSANENSRSDTMIVASVDKKTQQVVMVWIPRDTRVKVPSGRFDKINSVNAVNGPEAACKTAGDLLGTRIDYYVVSNFSGFEKIIDILGGVDINVESNMYHYDPNPKLSINLTKGTQHLNGADALRYVRYRGGPTADIGRTVRQQKFINALAREVFQGSTVLKLHQLLPELSKHVETNIPMSDMAFMAKVARDFDATKITTQTLPGYPYTEPGSGASYWQADADIARHIIDDLFAGKTYPVAQDPPRQTNYYSEPVTNELLEEEIPSETPEETDIEDGELDGPEGYLPPEPDTGLNTDTDIDTDINTEPADNAEETTAVPANPTPEDGAGLSGVSN